MDSSIGYKRTVKKVEKQSMYLLEANRYWQAIAIIPKIVLEYSKLFSFLKQKQSLQGQFSSFHFLILFLKVFKLSISF